jgi:hypothetical protein
LSASLAEGNSALSESLSELNVGSDEVLDVLAMLDAGGGDLTETMEFLARKFGFTSEQAALLSSTFGNTEGVIPTDEFMELASSLGIGEDELMAFSDAWNGFIESADNSDIQQIARDFLDQRVAATNAKDSLVELAEARSGEKRQTGDALAVYREWVDVVANASDEQLTAAGVTAEVQAETALLGASLGVAAEGYREVTVAVVDAAAAMETLSATADILNRNLAGGGGSTSAEQWAWIDGFGQALADVTSIQSGFVSSQDAIWESALKFGEAIDENSRSLEQNSLEGLTNRGVIADWTADIIAGAQAGLEQGDSIAQVTDTFKHNRQAMIDAAVAAGFERDEVEQLVDQLGAADGDWEAAIKISGDQIAMQKLEAMLLLKDDLTEADVIQINTDLETGGAWFALSEFKRRVASTHATLDVWANTGPARDAINRLNNISIGVGIYGGRFAEGGIVSGEQLVTVGESGPELILPLNNPTRMSELLGMPQVASALGSMGAWMPQYGWSGGGGSSGGGSVTNTNVTVHMPPGSNGDDVVRALRKWERRRGPVPISTR